MVIVKGATGDAAERRRDWGSNLSAFLDEAQVTRKDLQGRLSAVGFDVSLQAISQWCRGQTSPRPEMQAAIGRVLGVPARVLFPLPQVRS